MVKKISINDNWLFRRGFDSKILELPINIADFYIVGLPHNNTVLDDCYFNDSELRGVCTYSRILIVPEDYNGSRLILSFEGVLSYVEVYVNGIFVTSHKGESPFEADITAPTKYNFENRIVLKVDSSLRKSVPSSGVRGPEIAYGGIHRDVFFSILNGQNIKDVYVCTPMVSEEESVVNIEVTMHDFYPDTDVRATVLKADGSIAAVIAPKSVQGAKVCLKGSVEECELWSPSSPTLYTLKTELLLGDKVLDTREIPFGFVSAVFKRDGFYLNGKLLKLIGLNRTDCYPTVGKAMPRSGQESDARLLKSGLGCNVVRCLGLASKDFIDECSRIGLLVIEDIAGDGYIGTGDWCDSIIDNVSDMVRRDRNSPCVIAWGVRVNNSRDYAELYFKTNKAAKDLDCLRATLGARSFMSSHIYEDVFGFNDYSSDPKGKAISRRTKVAKLFVPYLITEHTGKSFPVKLYDNEELGLEQAVRHLRVYDKVNESGRTSGAIGMSLSDFYTAKGKGSGDNVNYYGVTDLYRNYKTAAWAYASQGEDFVFSLSGGLAEGEFTASLYVFTNAEKVRVYRGDELVGEFLPAVRRYPHLKHPPIIIDDFIGSLPEADGITGIKLKLFKSVVCEAEKRSALGLKFLGRIKSVILKKLLNLGDEQFLKLIDKYSLSPPLGMVYRFEAIKEGNVAAVKTIGGKIKKTLKVSCDNTLVEIGKSYEIIRFTARLEDGLGNALKYDFTPLGIRVNGCFCVVGNENICFKGGIASFYVKNLALGKGKVTVMTNYGEKSIDIEAVEKPNMQQL